jgi:hypothetical protein
LDVPVLSLQRGQTLKTTMRALALVAIGVPGVASAQPPSASLDELLRTLERIERIQPDGNRSTALIDPLRNLALRYQEDEDRELAAAARERAHEVVRVNYGLDSLEQAPQIRQSIANEEARANPAAVWNMEPDLVRLAEREPDDV